MAVGKTNEGESLPANLEGREVISPRSGEAMDKDIPHLCVTRSIINDSCKLTSHSLQCRSRDDSPLLCPLFFSSLPRGLEGMQWEYGRLMCAGWCWKSKD